MRFKGFFKEYWNMVFKPSISWMKKYWLPYSIVLLITWVCSFLYVWTRYCSLVDLKEILFKKRTDEEDIDEFLK